MNKRGMQLFQKMKTVLVAIIMLSLTCSFILFPSEALHASSRGLHTWFEIVFPSLLPFFILAELLISFGVVQFIGGMFDPFMRPLFRVPGVASFAWIVGMASGFPAGAKITATLRENKHITKIEGDRLLAFSNAASPLFLFGVIAVGFFHDERIGLLLALSHYLSNLVIGMLMRFYHKNEKNKASFHQSTFFVMRALKQMHRTRLKETRTTGELIGDAVHSSVQTLLIIGGYIILFSVLTHMLQLFTLFKKLMITIVPTPLEEAIFPFISGLFEITTGTELIASLHSVPLLYQLCMISFILAFNSFSIQAQVATVISKTDIHFLPYFFARIAHGLLAIVFCYTFYTIYDQHTNYFSRIVPTSMIEQSYTYTLGLFLQTYGFYITFWMIFIAFILQLRKVIQ